MLLFLTSWAVLLAIMVLYNIFKVYKTRNRGWGNRDIWDEDNFGDFGVYAFISGMLSVIFWIVSSLTINLITTYKPDTIVTKYQELVSFGDFNKVSGTFELGYGNINTEPGYIGFVKKDGGYTKYEMPSNSIIVEVPNTNTGIHEYDVCIPGDEPGEMLFNTVQKLRCDANTGSKDMRSIIRVPTGTIIRKFSTGSR